MVVLKPILGMTGFTGLIRDFDEQIMCDFYGNIGYSNILHVEILALMHEIQICWERHYLLH
jgi:hypothetical protein